MTIIIAAFEQSPDGGKGVALDARPHSGPASSSSAVHPKRNALHTCPAAADLFDELS